jgi:quinol monooxygenase YgiN
MLWQAQQKPLFGPGPAASCAARAWLRGPVGAARGGEDRIRAVDRARDETGASMYARLVSFSLQDGKESVATELARDLVPDISLQPGCQAVTCFGDPETGQYYLYVLWGSQEQADAAAAGMAPKLQSHLAGHTVAPPERKLYPVIEWA